MGALHTYEVEVNGQKTTMLLTDEDAARYGLSPSDALDAPVQPAVTTTKAAAAPANKSSTPANKSASRESTE